MSSESTVIVTGASGDIGLSIMERLIADGLKVAACCRSNPEKVARAFGSDVRIHELDLRDEASIKTCAARTHTHQEERGKQSHASSGARQALTWVKKGAASTHMHQEERGSPA